MAIRVLINLQPANSFVKNHAKLRLRTAQRQFRNKKYFEGTRIAPQVCKLLWIQGRYTFFPHTTLGSLYSSDLLAEIDKHAHICVFCRLIDMLCETKV